jgi:hypothetical protein
MCIAGSTLTLVQGCKLPAFGDAEAGGGMEVGGTGGMA